MSLHLKPRTITFFIVEHDTADPFIADGAIIFEQYTKTEREAVMEQAQGICNGGLYGRVWVGEVSTTTLVELTPQRKMDPLTIEG